MNENTTTTLKSIVAFEKEIIQKAKDILIELTNIDNKVLELDLYQIDTDNETYTVGFCYYITRDFGSIKNYKTITITKEGGLIEFKSK